MTHLNEEQRHGMADGSLESASAAAHLRECAECSADVDRIRRLMTRVANSKPAPADADDLWPSIRARIEETKVVSLPAQQVARPGARPRRHKWVLGIGGLLTASLIGLWLAQPLVDGVDSTNVAQVGDSGVSLVAIMDSTHAFEEEAQALLNRLELQRATMRPELARIVERDLRAIDVAIAELQGAIRNDPNNPALRRLLASSYRQKVDLLKRVNNAS